MRWKLLKKQVQLTALELLSHGALIQRLKLMSAPKKVVQIQCPVQFPISKLTIHILELEFHLLRATLEDQLVTYFSLAFTLISF